MALIWSERTIPGMATNYLADIAEIAGLAVVCSPSGLIYTSPNLIDWTQRATWLEESPKSMHAAGGLLVAVGEGWAAPTSRILTTTDGITWVGRASPLSAGLLKVIELNGLWLAGGYQSKVCRSADGFTWTASTTPAGADNDIVAFAHGAGAYVAVGWGRIMSSPDGATWTTRVSPASAWVNGIAFGNGVFVAVDGDGKVHRSADGVAWTSTQVTPGGVGGGLNAVVHTGDVFVAVGDEGRVYVSVDGTSWALSNTGAKDLDAVAAIDGMIVAAGQDGYATYSEDGGTTWAVQAQAYSTLQTTVARYVRGAVVAGGWHEGTIGVGEVESVDSVTLPITVTVVAAGQRATLPLRVAVVAPDTATLPLRVSVIDAAALAGLDGAGGWAAAPGGAWRPVVQLDGVDISDRLLGEITVTHSRDAAAVAEFALLPAAPMQPLSLIGRRVTVSFARADGSAVQRMFTGVVDVPRIDLATGAIGLSCHDQAQEVWTNTPREAIDALVGGRWSLAVSGEPADNHAYLLERIQSRGASWALDVLQSPRIMPWGTGARTLTVRTADVIDGSVSVDLPSREQIRTRVVCRLQYRYTRLRYRGAIAQWAEDIHFFKPRITATTSYPGVQWLTTGMVQSACESVSGWDLIGEPRIEHPPAQSWQIGDTIASGYYTIDARTAPELAMSFSATYSTRWRQVVTEDYTVTVVCSALESQIGAPVGEELGATLESAFDQPDWERDPSLEQMLSNTYGAGDMHEDWQPAGFDDAARDDALRTLLDRAWVRIWAASRSGRVTFGVPLRPDIWLDTRIVLEHARLRASGDVQEVTHTMDPESGSAISSVTLAVGMPGAAAAAHPAWSLPASPADSYVPPIAAHSFEVGTYVGGQIGSPPYEEAEMIGFTSNLNGPVVEGRNYYPHQLSMRAPDIAPEDRDPLDLPAVAQIDVAIPTDTLEII